MSRDFAEALVSFLGMLSDTVAMVGGYYKSPDGRIWKITAYKVGPFKRRIDVVEIHTTSQR